MLADTFESLWLAVPIKEEDEVVEEMETSSSLEEDSIPVLSRLVLKLFGCFMLYYLLVGTTKLQLPSTWSFVEHVFQLSLVMKTLMCSSLLYVQWTNNSPLIFCFCEYICYKNCIQQ